VQGYAGGLGVDEIVDLLATGAGHLLRDGSSVSQLDHALQTASLLAREVPADDELATAALVHDIGHLLPGAGDETHAAAGADAVRGALGPRVADLVALHVDAKRYLVATEHAYGAELAPDSVASLVTQGGPMSPDEVAAFEALAPARAAVSLRRADDSGKVEGLEVRDLGDWAPVLRRLSERVRLRGAEVPSADERPGPT
jgi:predicted HD phosphohydrolase